MLCKKELEKSRVIIDAAKVMVKSSIMKGQQDIQGYLGVLANCCELLREKERRWFVIIAYEQLSHISDSQNFLLELIDKVFKLESSWQTKFVIGLLRAKTLNLLNRFTEADQ